MPNLNPSAGKTINIWIKCNILNILAICIKSDYRLDGRNRSTDSQGGMSLLEVMVALIMVGTLAVPLLGMFVQGSRLAGEARIKIAALYTAQQLQEAVKGIPYYMVGNPRGSTDTTISLAGGTGDIDLKDKLIAITAGSGRGQIRHIISYGSDSQVAAIDPRTPWADGQFPDCASTYLICDSGFQGMGIARGGQARTLVLATGDNIVDDLYNGYYLSIAGGAGSGQVRRVLDYNGTSAPQATAWLDRDWEVAPDETSLYRLYQYDYEIAAIVGGAGVKTIIVTVYFLQDSGMQTIMLTTDRADCK